MNTNMISEELKKRFSLLLEDIPLNNFPSSSIQVFIKFYKKLFFNLYKFFGFNYAFELAQRIGVELSNYMETLNDGEDFLPLLTARTRDILLALEESSEIDHSKQTSGLSRDFYNSLTPVERDVYRSYFLSSIIKITDSEQVIEISKCCEKNNIQYAEYFNHLTGIFAKYRNWQVKFRDSLNGTTIKF